MKAKMTFISIVFTLRNIISKKVHFFKLADLKSQLNWKTSF